MSVLAALLGGTCGAAGGVFAHGLFVPSSQLFGRVISRGTRSDPPCVAICFDDGPHPEFTPRVLDVLDDFGVKAAFFMIGRNIECAPRIVERVHEHGHIVANHTYSHAHLGALRGLTYWRRELNRTNRLIESIIGQRPAMMRPPMGQKTPMLHRAARIAGTHVVTWSRRAYDGIPTTGEAIVRRLGRSVSGGDIVTFHDGIDRNSTRNLNPTIKALPLLLGQWSCEGLQVLRLDALTGLAPYQTAAPQAHPSR